MSGKKLYEMTREEIKSFLLPRLIAISLLSAGLGALGTLIIFILTGVWDLEW